MFKIKGFDPDAPREFQPLPSGKLNVVWRQARGGLVATVAGRDLPGVSCHPSTPEVIEEIEFLFGPEAAERFRAAGFGK